MKSLWPTTALLLCTLITANVRAQQAASPRVEDDSAARAEIQAVINEYVKSVDTQDVTLAAKIWSHAPEATFIYPLGVEHGLDNILANVYGRTMGAFSKRELILGPAAIHVYGDTAWSEYAWTFHATEKDTGKPITNTGRETQIYHKEEGRWRIVHVHYSGALVAEAGQGF